MVWSGNDFQLCLQLPYWVGFVFTEVLLEFCSSFARASARVFAMIQLFSIAVTGKLFHGALQTWLYALLPLSAAEIKVREVCPRRPNLNFLYQEM